MALYDKESASYDNWYQSPQGQFIDEIETNLVFEMLQPKKGMKILDVGCGTGNLAVKLAKKGVTVIGIDVSEGMLLKAHDKGTGLSVHFEKMNASNLNFLTNYFDAVISVTAFEFMKFPEASFKEMHRVVKHGGPIVIGTLNKNSSWGQLYSTQDFQSKTIFKRSKLKSREDLEKYYPKKLVEIRECLFIPPDASPEGFNLESEKQLSKTNPGGFLCALWKK